MSVDTVVLEGKTIRADIPTGSLKGTKPSRNKRRERARESLKKIEDKAFRDVKAVPGISVFAIFGTFIIAVLMVFVVLAQINYNETASEAARLNSELRELSERHRLLELTFESSFDIREVERIAKDELGMSRPDTTQVITIRTTPRDTATVIVGGEESSAQGFAEFIRTLTEYFR